MGRSRSAKQLDYSIQSVVRGTRIVDAIAGTEKEIGAQQISTNLGLNISTVFRFLQTLSQCGLVEQNPETGKYRLGLKLLDWGMQVLRRMDLRRDALPFLRELNEKTREMVHLTVYDRDAAIYIEKIESPTPLRVYSEVGKAAPLHCTGVGKVLMAALSEEELAELLKRYPLRRFTANTITQVGTLKSELSRIRAQGFAMDNEEHEEHIQCVAAPIQNHTGKVVASISIAGPTTRVTPARVPELIEAVKETARKISARLGYTSAKATGQDQSRHRSSSPSTSKTANARKGRPRGQHQYVQN